MSAVAPPLGPVVRLPELRASASSGDARRRARRPIVATLLVSGAAHAAALGLLPGLDGAGPPAPEPLRVTLVTPPPAIRAPEPPPVVVPKVPLAAPPKAPPVVQPVVQPRAQPRPTPVVEKPVEPPREVVPPASAPAAANPVVPPPVPMVATPPTLAATAQPVDRPAAPAPVALAAAVPAVAAPAPAVPAERIEPPHFGLAYLNNPPPDYPAAARRMQLEGTVLVRVLVGEQGDPRELAVARTSGAPVLDQAALRAIRGWRFVPARRGDTPIAHWAEVPVHFRLQD